MRLWDLEDYLVNNFYKDDFINNHTRKDLGEILRRLMPHMTKHTCYPAFSQGSCCKKRMCSHIEFYINLHMQGARLRTQLGLGYLDHLFKYGETVYILTKTPNSDIPEIIECKITSITVSNVTTITVFGYDKFESTYKSTMNINKLGTGFFLDYRGAKIKLYEITKGAE